MKFILATAFISILSLPACSSSNPNESNVPGPAAGQATAEENQVYGLWVIPTEVDPNVSSDSSIVSDTDFFELTDNNMIFYSAATTDNCYYVVMFPMTKLAGSKYSVDFGRLTSHDGGSVVDFTAANDTLTYSFVDMEDEDGDGNTTETIVETYVRADNISSIDLNICS